MNSNQACDELRLPVCAGIVAHNPQRHAIQSLIEKLAGCVQWVILIDNCSQDAQYLQSIPHHDRVTVIQNDENRGVSGGINQIIDFAKQVNAKYVTAYDQDTTITEELIGTLVSDLESLLDAGEPVAAIGPLVIDDFTNVSLPFINFRFPFNARYAHELDECGGVVECHFLISSGCLMSMKAIEDIGGMNEELFIDNVDLDWCFRAVSKQYKVYGDFGGAIRQRIGEYCTQIPFTNSVIRHHNYRRIYYMTRNRFWLYRQAYVNSAWVYHDVCRFSAKFMYLLLFRGNRLKLLNNSMRGVLDSFSLQSIKSGNV